MEKAEQGSQTSEQPGLNERSGTVNSQEFAVGKKIIRWEPHIMESHPGVGLQAADVPRCSNHYWTFQAFSFWERHGAAVPALIESNSISWLVMQGVRSDALQSHVGVQLEGVSGLQKCCRTSARFARAHGHHSIHAQTCPNHNSVRVPRAYGHPSIHAQNRIVALCLTKNMKKCILVRLRVLPTLEFTGRASDSCTFARVLARANRARGCC